MKNKSKETSQYFKYIRVLLSGFMLAFLSYFILAYFRNSGFVPFRYLFF